MLTIASCEESTIEASSSFACASRRRSVLSRITTTVPASARASDNSAGNSEPSTQRATASTGPSGRYGRPRGTTASTGWPAISPRP
ncbi:MAG: hypothetical protein AUI14_14070 [Actinobacteria bacterium 13_2_20CM_2_71_6]|nr:MAG: hypothetical protein AUI14_14070 [Actinobacteria bacterium 13_2_20CM_2_71_6]